MSPVFFLQCLFSNAIFDFQTFLSVIEVKFTQHFQKEEMQEIINDIYDEYVEDTIKKVTKFSSS